jgi:hypothetical protein
MCELLDDNTHYKMKLQLTDLQVKKVIEFTSSKRLHDLLSEQERLARLRSEGSRSDGNNDIYWAIEAEAIEEVKSFLSEKQIRELKNFSLEMRCDGGIMAFFDREICDACGIVIDDKFREFLQQKLKLKLTQNQQLRTEAVTSYLKEFSPHQRVLLAQFLGNKYMPGVLVSSNPTAEVGEVPFIDATWAFKGPILVELLDPNSKLSSQIGITTDQKMKLDELKQNFSRGMRMGGSQLEPIERYFDKLNSILSHNQIVELARVKNAERLVSDFSWPFRSSEIKDYLGLDDQGARDLLNLSESEYKKFKEQMASLDRQTFLEICERVPQPGRQRIQGLYAEVWLNAN